ncbi:MAG: GGDEF domain-containing protein [Bacilli bacterium]
MLSKSDETYTITVKWTFTTKEGKEIYTELTFSILNNIDNSRNILCLIKNLNEIMEYNTEIKTLKEYAYKDTLCGIYNRRYFMERINIIGQNTLKNNNTSSIAVSLFDIDNFKLINDNYGHDCGDYVLYTIAQISNNILSNYGVFARFGGEEFISYIIGKTKQENFDIADKIRKEIKKFNFTYQKFSFKVTVSIGIYYGSTLDYYITMIKEADAKLYLAKSSGKNSVQIN